MKSDQDLIFESYIKGISQSDEERTVPRELSKEDFFKLADDYEIDRVFRRTGPYTGYAEIEFKVGDTTYEGIADVTNLGQDDWAVSGKVDQIKSKTEKESETMCSMCDEVPVDRKGDICYKCDHALGDREPEYEPSQLTFDY